MRQLFVGGNLSRRAIGATVGLFVVVAGAGGAWSQDRPEGKSQPAKVQEKDARQDLPSQGRAEVSWPPTPVPEVDSTKQALQDEVDIAAARVAAKRGEVRIAKARLARVRQAAESVADKFKRGFVSENSVTLAKLDLEEHEAWLEIRQAELKEREVRLAALQRALAYGAMPVTTTTGSSRNDLQGRVETLERLMGNLEELNWDRKRTVYSTGR